MPSRRAFIRCGASLATLAALPLRAALAASPEGAAAGASLAVVDRSLATSAAFAATAAAGGLTVLAFERDVAGLWMSALEPRLRAGPVTLAGHTSAATLFCLDFLARDYGARTVHDVRVAGAATWMISSLPGRRAALAPVAVLRSASHA